MRAYSSVKLTPEIFRGEKEKEREAATGIERLWASKGVFFCKDEYSIANIYIQFEAKTSVMYYVTTFNVLGGTKYTVRVQ